MSTKTRKRLCFGQNLTLAFYIVSWNLKAQLHQNKTTIPSIYKI